MGNMVSEMIAGTLFFFKVRILKITVSARCSYWKIKIYTCKYTYIYMYRSISKVYRAIPFYKTWVIVIQTRHVYSDLSHELQTLIFSSCPIAPGIWHVLNGTHVSLLTRSPSLTPILLSTVVMMGVSTCIFIQLGTWAIVQILSSR